MIASRAKFANDHDVPSQRHRDSERGGAARHHNLLGLGPGRSALLHCLRATAPPLVASTAVVPSSAVEMRNAGDELDARSLATSFACWDQVDPERVKIISRVFAQLSRRPSEGSAEHEDGVAADGDSSAEVANRVARREIRTGVNVCRD